MERLIKKRVNDLKCNTSCEMVRDLEVGKVLLIKKDNYVIG